VQRQEAKRTLMQMRVFFIVICQFQLISMIDRFLKDTGLTLSKETGDLAQRLIYSVSECVLLLGIFLSMNKSMLALDEEEERSKALTDSSFFADAPRGNYLTNKFLQRGRKQLSINMEE
jgi:hypothetical protein